MPGDLLQLCRKDDVLAAPAMKSVDLAKDRQHAVEEIIELVIQGVSREIERACKRRFLRMARTEIFDVARDVDCLFLDAYPVTSIATVKEDVNSNFGSAAALAATDYALSRGGENGLLYRRGGCWMPGISTTQVVWTGGLATSVDSVPEDLRRAAIMQVCFEVLRMPTLHLDSVGMSEGSASLQSEVTLLPLVKSALLHGGYIARYG